MSRVDLVAGLCFSLLGIVLAIHSLLACSVSVEKSAATLFRAPLYVSVSSLLSLRFTLPLGIYHFNYNGLFLFLLIGTLCPSWTCMNSLIKLRKFSIISFSNRFSIPYSFSSPSGIPIIWILLHFMLS